MFGARAKFFKMRFSKRQAGRKSSRRAEQLLQAQDASDDKENTAPQNALTLTIHDVKATAEPDLNSTSPLSVADLDESTKERTEVAVLGAKSSARPTLIVPRLKKDNLDLHIEIELTPPIEIELTPPVFSVCDTTSTPGQSI